MHTATRPPLNDTLIALEGAKCTYLFHLNFKGGDSLLSQLWVPGSCGSPSVASGKLSFHLNLAISLRSAEEKDKNRVADDIADGWTVPSPLANPRYACGFNDCDEPPPLTGIALAA